MASTVESTLVLTGIYAGKTISLREFNFVDGELELIGAEKDVRGLTNYVGKSYQAFPKGSPELASAQRRDEENNGEHKVRESAQHGQDDNVSDDGVQPPGERASSSSTTYEPGSDGTEAGGAGVRAEGDGHEDAGLPPGAEPERAVKMAKAIRNLDPADDEHWTANGLPACAAVEKFYGDANVTRKMVAASLPGYTRRMAESR